MFIKLSALRSEYTNIKLGTYFFIKLIFTSFKLVIFSEKITSINESNIELIRKYPPNVIFVYSLRSAESFNSIVANYSLAPMMTQSVVMCISKKIADFFNKAGWKNNKVFNPGNEIIELEKIK